MPLKDRIVELRASVACARTRHMKLQSLIDRDSRVNHTDNNSNSEENDINDSVHFPRQSEHTC